MSPEYAMEGVFSIKSDVYSFGVLMLEILSGRRNSSFYNADHALNLVGYVCNIYRLKSYTLSWLFVPNILNDYYIFLFLFRHGIYGKKVKG